MPVVQPRSHQRTFQAATVPPLSPASDSVATPSSSPLSVTGPATHFATRRGQLNTVAPRQLAAAPRDPNVYAAAVQLQPGTNITLASTNSTSLAAVRSARRVHRSTDKSPSHGDTCQGRDPQAAPQVRQLHKLHDANFVHPVRSRSTEGRELAPGNEGEIRCPEMQQDLDIGASPYRHASHHRQVGVEA
jgi:hypothetical protein